MFNSLSFYYFIEYFSIYINVFLKRPLGLIKLSRIFFTRYFCYRLLFNHTAAAE